MTFSSAFCLKAIRDILKDILGTGIIDPKVILRRFREMKTSDSLSPFGLAGANYDVDAGADADADVDANTA